MTVTPYADMCNMNFIQFHSRKDNTEKKISESSNFTCINICCAIIVVGSVYYLFIIYFIKRILEIIKKKILQMSVNFDIILLH
jgi:hypothetical protein